MLDISDTIEPKSDQLNADDLVAGPQIVTITGVGRGTSEQPVNLTTDRYGDARPYKPGKSMRRVLVAAWGTDASAYVGQRMMLYCDPSIQFGGQTVGGIRISHMTGIDKPLSVLLTTTRSKRSKFVVEPLRERDWAAEIKQAGTREQLLELLNQAPPQWRDQIIAEGRARFPQTAAAAEPEQLPGE